MKISILSPHRDDAAFSLGLAIDAWLSAKHSVQVVNCFTRSAYAPYSDAGSLHENDRRSFVSALRQREDLAWRRHYGRGLSLVDLNLKDAPLRLHCTSDEVCTRSVRMEEKAVVKIRAALNKSDTPTVLPLGIGVHVDHLTVREAALSEIGPTAPLAFFEDLPYASRDDAVDPESAARELANGTGMSLEPYFADAQLHGEDAVARKRQLALCYDSQIDDRTVEQLARYCLRHRGRDRLWCNVAWRNLFCPDLRCGTPKPL